MTVQIDKRFCGPPNSGNGGYVGGLIAKQLGRSAKVRLLAPPPLNEPLELDQEEGIVRLKQGDVVLGTGEAVEFDLSLPEFPNLDAATKAQARYIAYHDHFFPNCFVCGPEREEGDGLRIFPGPLNSEDGAVHACTWFPSSEFADDKGNVQLEYIWAALDCPTFFAVMGDSPRIALLGEMSLKLVKDLPFDSEKPLIVVSWPISSSGRKHLGGGALIDSEGDVYAYALGTWIELKK